MHLRPSPSPSTLLIPRQRLLTRLPRLPQTSSISIITKRHSSSTPHYDPPTGNLFNVPPGQKYEKEGWETIWYWGVWGSFGLVCVAYAFKPDTSIQTWALEEAKRRLEKEGILSEK